VSHPDYPPPTSALMGAMEGVGFLEDIANWATRDQWREAQVASALRTVGVETSVPKTMRRVQELQESIEAMAPEIDAALASLSKLLETVSDIRSEISVLCKRDAPPEQAEQLIEALSAWAETHDGLAPRQRDWEPAADPDGTWPRATFVIRIFRDDARTAGVSPWAYALGRAGLAVRTPKDALAKNAVRLGRNRQMVTGGAVNQRPQIFNE